jgi:hypothetical protein
VELLAWSAAGSMIWTAGDERVSMFADLWRFEGMEEG